MKYKCYQVQFCPCGGTRFTFKTVKEIYKFCEVYNKQPLSVIGFTNVTEGYYLQIVKKKSYPGWKIVL